MASVTVRWQFKVMSVLMIAVFGLLTALRVAFWFVTHPWSWFMKKDRSEMPEILLDPTLGVHEYMSANGLKFHYVVRGERTKPLMLLLHGFPEFWFSWRHQLREFGNDYRVIAIDMRGYGDTTRPKHVWDYSFDKLRMDVVELISQFGYAKCTLVAHDWGGVIAWRVAQHHPELVDNLIIMNCPHPKVYANYISSNWKQIYKAWYVFMFQLPKLPELAMFIYDYDSLVQLFTKPPAGAITKGAFPPDVIEAYKYTFAKPGALTAAINYYRCMFVRRQGLPPGMKKVAPPPEKITVPTLLIWGEKDAALNLEMAGMHTSLATNITIRRIPDCSHWVQQDKPEIVNKHMWDFLNAQED